MNTVWSRIQAGINEYEKDIVNLSDIELYDHVYGDDYDPNDFVSKELEKRGIAKCGCSGALQTFGCAAKSCCYWERKPNDL